MQKIFLLTLALLAAPAVSAFAEAATAPASQPAVIDVKNTKCIVSPDDDIDPALTSTYNGKLYHFCCKGCKGEFDKHPDQYIKAFEADPTKYGVTK